MIAAADSSEGELVAGAPNANRCSPSGDPALAGCRLHPGCALLWSNHGFSAEPQAGV